MTTGTTPDRERLYELMPAVYRERDAELGYPLRALLRIVADQASLVDRDIQGLWDDLFIETSTPWVIPYIGDLVSNDLLFDASRIASPDTAAELFTDLRGPSLRPPVAVRVRADVAKTIYYRRRKGTLPMLEELARDVTGWPAHAVEFFELLGWNQMLEHFRSQSAWTDVRSVERMGRVQGAFDDTSHTLDVRRIDQSEGWYGIRNVGFFLWRLHGYPLEDVPARPVAGGPAWRYHFSPLGNPAPLFVRQRREGDETGLATELHVPGPIRRSFFEKDLRSYKDAGPPRADFTDLYGLFEPAPPTTLSPNPLASLVVFRNGTPVAPAFDPNAPSGPLYQPQIVCRRLDPWPAVQPVGRLIAVDVETGRLAVGDGWGDPTTSVDVWFHYGFGLRRRWGTVRAPRLADPLGPGVAPAPPVGQRGGRLPARHGRERPFHESDRCAHRLGHSGRGRSGPTGQRGGDHPGQPDLRPPGCRRPAQRGLARDRGRRRPAAGPPDRHGRRRRSGSRSSRRSSPAIPTVRRH